MFSDSATERFWSKVAIAGPDDCWEWQASLNDDGYGAFKFDGRRQVASRIAYEMTFGELPPTILACHSCDNRPCCNPNHLWPGTYVDNANDMMAKGRGGHRAIMGERHHSSRLKEDDVRMIRMLAAAGLTQRAIASRFPVSFVAVGNILRGKTWKSVI